jgi:hypothetical protein
MQALSSRIAGALAWAALGAATLLASYHYLVVKQSFFDDVFIYLHMARNAVESGTWQYFPVVDREALLASSPLKLVLLTAATAIASVIGFGTRSLDHAQLILLLAGALGWLAFVPLWRRRMAVYALAGAIYALSATIFAASFDFEGGLLFLWICSLVLHLIREDVQPRALALLLPVGGLIRPDLALVVYTVLLAVAATDPTVRQRLFGMRWPWLLVAPLLWVALALSLSVYPLPVTYWAKAVVPTLFEQESFLQKVFERVGLVMGAPGAMSPNTATVIGVLVLALAASVTLPRTRNPAVVGIAVVVVCVGLFGRMPANFWWYYENVVLVVLGVLLVNVVFERRPGFGLVRATSGLLIAAVLLFGVWSKSLRDQPGLWSFARDAAGRTKGYLFLARHANGDGTYTLPELGRVLLKNPEVGITSYFSGRGAWIWDSAGLAQPLDIPAVRRSVLRYAYPPSLRVDAVEDAQSLVDRAGEPLQVVEAWAMEDRDFDKARKVCKVVIVEGALCVNPFRTMTPHAH